MTLEAQIRRFTEAGKSQKEIAILTGTSRGTVHRRQKAMGLCPPYRGPRLSPERSQAARVLELLRRGDSWRQICNELKVRESSVRRIAKENNIRRVTQWDLVPPVMQAKILEEIRERRNFGVDLAYKYGVSYKLILRLAHRELACPKFRSGYGEPLSSNFPQKHHQRKAG
jgi:hypothetical protein